MGRPKHPTVSTLHARDRRAALVEVSTGLNDLLRLANRHRTDQGELGAFARDVDRVLEGLGTGASGAFHGWPLWAAVTAGNLYALLRTGGGYLRRCRCCSQWCLVYDARRVTCNRRECWRIANRSRQAAWRQRTF
jgi:hypothetical protein